MKNLPIGTQSFENLRENDNLYVDKTELIYRIATTGRIYFLSRPRRFGKSLTISTLKALFRGQKELFKGLWIENKWDWTQAPNPVIHFDWSAIEHDTAAMMEEDTKAYIHKIGVDYGLNLQRPFAAGQFGELIQELHQKTGRKVVILIDEYDCPIFDSLDLPLLDDVKRFLQKFYRQLKANDDHIRFIFMTGITKYAKLSLFSTLNNPLDITMDEKYAALCGYTQAELEYYFTEYIDATAAKMGNTRERLIERIRYWYDGYTWDGKTHVYNPFSTLNFFEMKRFRDYWFNSGTPTYLIEQLKKRDEAVLIMNPVTVNENKFDSFDPENIDNIALMLQSGYLTVKDIQIKDETPEYTLGVPNEEVKNSMMTYLVSLFSFKALSKVDFIIQDMMAQLRSLDSEGFAGSIGSLIANIPYPLQIKNEKYYHSLFLSWMLSMGFKIDGEVMTNIGRIDAVLETPEMTVVSELKFHVRKSVTKLLDEAMTQINDRRYYEKYQQQSKPIVLMGLAFSGKKTGCRFKQI
ncbi:MAG: ATP-binding protein [Tannerella sp.]|jgi:hypothetical protein|nr:ATP-binding protein [Tannerella sp.]